MRIYKEENAYVIERDADTVIRLTANEASLLVNIFNKDSLREAVDYALDQLIDNGDINIDAYEDGREDFVSSICDYYSDDVEQTGSIPDEEEIEEHILDEAKWYDGMLNEED